MPDIPYNSIAFPARLGPNFVDPSVCNCTWAEIVWAAISVGRRERVHLLRFGWPSWYEMLYRSAIIWSNLVQNSNARLRRSFAYDALDPSEKGAISYFLGLTIAKLFAERYLHVPWLSHLDVYWSTLKPLMYGNTGSRPDLVGQNAR